MLIPYISLSIFIILFIILFNFFYKTKTTTHLGAGQELHGFDKIKSNIFTSVLFASFISIPILVIELIVRIIYVMIT